MSEDIQAFLASKKEESDHEEDVNPEEEVKGDWKAVDLPEVQVVTGEENKDLLYKERARLYRWDDEQWKERGTGTVKLLRDRETHRVCLVMRQESTKKVVANFIIEDSPLCDLVSHSGSDKAWLWMCFDFSEGERVRSKLALRLGTPEKALQFKQAFEDAKVYNTNIRQGREAVEAPVIEDTPEA